MIICSARPDKVLLISPRTGRLNEPEKWLFMRKALRYWQHRNSVRAEMLKATLKQEGLSGYVAVHRERRDPINPPEGLPGGPQSTMSAENS